MPNALIAIKKVINHRNARKSNPKIKKKIQKKRIYKTIKFCAINVTKRGILPQIVQITIKINLNCKIRDKTSFSVTYVTWMVILHLSVPRSSKTKRFRIKMKKKDDQRR
jgi:hypothetical protein